MAVNTIKNVDPLFTVIFRDQTANTLLNKWTSDNRTRSAQVVDNKMHLFDHSVLNVFMVTWEHGWENILIWDAWNKRHIYQND